MPFFDDLSKKITQVGQSAVQKTKDMADLAKINSAISAEEGSLDNLYYRIGKLYVERHPDTSEKEFAEIIAMIRETEQKIAEYRQQAQDIKGVKRCEKCGAEVPAGAAFCNACGTPMPKQSVAENADMIRCSKCGSMMISGTRFCTSCGNPLEVSTPTAAEPLPIERPVPETPMEDALQQEGQICSYCGAPIKEGTAFCTECGKKLELH